MQICSKNSEFLRQHGERELRGNEVCKELREFLFFSTLCDRSFFMFAVIIVRQRDENSRYFYTFSRKVLFWGLIHKLCNTLQKVLSNLIFNEH